MRTGGHRIGFEFLSPRTATTSEEWDPDCSTDPTVPFSPVQIHTIVTAGSELCRPGGLHVKSLL